MCQECEERLVYDKVGTPKLLANLSNQDHIAGVRLGKKLRVLPRPSLSVFLLVAWQGRLHVYCVASNTGTQGGCRCYMVTSFNCSLFT